jgi:hypothetical protein
MPPFGFAISNFNQIHHHFFCCNSFLGLQLATLLEIASLGPAAIS